VQSFRFPRRIALYQKGNDGIIIIKIFIQEEKSQTCVRGCQLRQEWQLLKAFCGSARRAGAAGWTGALEGSQDGETVRDAQNSMPLYSLYILTAFFVNCIT
jgi:hypothetical protein